MTPPRKTLAQTAVTMARIAPAIALASALAAPSAGAAALTVNGPAATSSTVSSPALTAPSSGISARRKPSAAVPAPALTPAMAQCFDWASRRFGMSSRLLYAIALQESGLNPRAVNRNTNGSQDIGLMQINSSWGPMLARYGIRSTDLWDPCTNIFVGAWILGDNLVRMGPTVAALGAYNARDPVKREAYAHRVLERLHRLTTPPPDARFWQQAPTTVPHLASP